MWAVSGAAVDPSRGKERQMSWVPTPTRPAFHCQSVFDFLTKCTGKLTYFHNGFRCMISFPQAEGLDQFGVREFTKCEDLT